MWRLESIFCLVWFFIVDCIDFVSFVVDNIVKRYRLEVEFFKYLEIWEIVNVMYCECEFIR